MNTQRGPMPGTCVSRTVTRHDTRPRPHTCEVAKSDCGHWRWSLSLRHSARTTDSKGDEAIGFMSGWGRHRARAVRIFLKQPFTRHTRLARRGTLKRFPEFTLQFVSPGFFVRPQPYHTSAARGAARRPARPRGSRREAARPDSGRESVRSPSHRPQ
jgi:hypothetical protein